MPCRKSLESFQTPRQPSRLQRRCGNPFTELKRLRPRSLIMRHSPKEFGRFTAHCRAAGLAESHSPKSPKRMDACSELATASRCSWSWRVCAERLAARRVARAILPVSGALDTGRIARSTSRVRQAFEGEPKAGSCGMQTGRRGIILIPQRCACAHRPQTRDQDDPPPPAAEENLGRAGGKGMIGVLMLSMNYVSAPCAPWPGNRVCQVLAQTSRPSHAGAASLNPAL